MTPYFYKIKHVSSGRIYVGCQYGKKSNPDNFFVKYFTSSDAVKSIIEAEGKESFIIETIIIRKDARNFEKRYLSFIFHILGKDNFCKIFINRNLAPGIILDDAAIEKLKKSLKEAWKKPGRKEQHSKRMQDRVNDGFYERRKGNIKPLSQEKIAEMSEAMKKNNPMYNLDTKAKHLAAVNTPKELQRKKETATGNTYTKNRSWYNNGEISKMFYECPDDTWKPGRLNTHWNINRKKNEE